MRDKMLRNKVKIQDQIASVLKTLKPFQAYGI